VDEGIFKMALLTSIFCGPLRRVKVLKARAHKVQAVFEKCRVKSGIHVTVTRLGIETP
jgi:hypothetical protein